MPPPLPLQQGWPRPPQATQVLLSQVVQGAVQPTLLLQQAWPSWPQVPQAPALQLAPLPHVEPILMQVGLCCDESQQRPAAQLLPAQQG
jgi:hypothetical protein